MSGELIGAWIAVFLTLAIFSYLYKDNAFYKIAEHLFVGISAGYWTSMFFWTQIQPNLFGRLWPSSHYDSESLWYGIYNAMSWINSSVFPAGGIDKGHEMHLIYLIPFALGIMMLLSVFDKLSWFARWGIAYTVGMAAGLRAYVYLNSNVIAQVRNSTLNFSDPDMPVFALIGNSYFNGIVLLIGTIAGLLYFYFSKEQKGAFGKVTRVGIYFLMVSFGASFGFAVMGRISLLIGRFVDLIAYNGTQYHHATSWILVIMVILLGYSAYNDKDNPETEGS